MAPIELEIAKQRERALREFVEINGTTQGFEDFWKEAEPEAARFALQTVKEADLEEEERKKEPPEFNPYKASATEITEFIEQFGDAVYADACERAVGR